MRMKADVSLCETDNSAVILNERTGRYWQLNETGAGILRSLLHGATGPEIASRLSEVRPVCREQAVTDIHALLENLAAADLIERS